MFISALTLLAGCGSSNPARTPIQSAEPAREPPAAVLAASTPVPGHVRLAFAARPGDSKDVTTPRHPTAELVVFVDVDLWETIPKGATFFAVGSGGGVSVTYTGTARGRYGCDGGHDVTWATFDAASPLPEGVALLFPNGEGEGLEPWPIAVQGTPTKTERTWTLGPEGKASIKRSGPLTATYSVDLSGLIPHTSEHETYTMQGADPAAIDFTEGPNIGIPAPVLVLSGERTAFVVSFRESFESLHFDWMQMGLKLPAGTTSESLYYCAF